MAETMSSVTVNFSEVSSMALSTIFKTAASVNSSGVSSVTSATIFKTTTSVAPNDTSLFKKIEDDFKLLDSETVFLLLFTCVAVISWCVYIALYNSRLFGLVITLLLSKFYKGAYLSIGSFSLSVLGGKLMFRDIQYITEDASVRIRYAFAIFRWWGPYKAKDTTENLSNEPTRLQFYVEGFELHVYNRSSEYARLEKLFGLEELILPKQGQPRGSAEHEHGRAAGVSSKSIKQKAKKKAHKSGFNWRSLVPVIKVKIVDGQVLFGNPLLPTTLVIKFMLAKCNYSTKKASNPTDLFTHTVTGHTETLRVLLVPSSGYIGPRDEPPRNMGEGFVVAQTHHAEVYFYMDEPGIVPYGPEVLHMANGEVLMEQTFPVWGIEIKCSKMSPKKSAFGMTTNISYGPWADRQRSLLFKFFYPADHQTHPVLEAPQPGQKRIHRQFDFSMTILGDTMIDVLYTKDKEMHALHMQAAPGSYLELTLPLHVVEEKGYCTTIRGQLLHAESTTSLAYRDLLRAETLEFDLRLHYPRCWNDHQDWHLKFTACKASVFFLYDHVDFIYDMIMDWNSPSQVASIFSFVPYTVFLEVQLKEFEVIFLTNEYNWVNTSSSSIDENAHLAICGDFLSIPVTLPYHEFLPEVVNYKINVSGECIDARLFLPETNTSHQLLRVLAANSRIVDRNGVPLEQSFGMHNKWRKVTLPSVGWIDVMSTPMVGVSVKFASHPQHALDDEAYDDMMTSLFGQTHVSSSTACTASCASLGSRLLTDAGPVDFDRTILAADKVVVEVEVGSSVIMLYGSLLKYFLHLKENYFGENLKMVDTSSSTASDIQSPDHSATAAAASMPVRTVSREAPSERSDKATHCQQLPRKRFDPRAYRPYAVKVSVTLHDIQGHLVKHCSPTSLCPTAYVEGLAFEMDKRYEETKLQVVVSPVTLLAWDSYERSAGGSRNDAHLCRGHLSLSGLQVRGHGMFSHCELPIESDTVEYAWLMELTVGDVKGKITAPQLYSIVQFLRTGIYLIEDVENQLCRPSPEMCQHQNVQPLCELSQQMLAEHVQNAAPDPGEEQASWKAADNTSCPAEDDIKYKMTRVSVDLIDVCLAESGVALNVQVYPVRLAMCNLHGANNKAGVTALIQYVHLRQYIRVPSELSALALASDEQDLWLEAGALTLGPINVDAAMSLPAPETRILQHVFLQRHDARRRNLWFMWPDGSQPYRTTARGARRQPNTAPQAGSSCACHGGSAFFGHNENGCVFFHAPADLADFSGEVVRSMLAVPQLTELPRDPGYGQSILQHGSFVFAMPDVLPARRVPSTLSAGRKSGTGKQTHSSQTPSYGRSPRAVQWELQKGISGERCAQSVEDAENGLDYPSPSSTLKPGAAGAVAAGLMHPDYCGPVSPSSEGGESADEEGSDDSEAVTVVGKSKDNAEESRFDQSPPPPNVHFRDRAPSPAGQPSLVGSSRLRRNVPGTSSVEGINSRNAAASSLGSSESFYSAGSTFSVSQPRLPQKQSWARQLSTNSDSAATAAAARAASVYSGGSAHSLYELAQPFASPESTQGSFDEEAPKPDWYSEGSDVDKDDAVSHFIFDGNYYDGVAGGNVNINAEAASMHGESDGGNTLLSSSNLFTQSSNLVDLQAQLKDKITKSSMLMTCYTRHMTQLHCRCWSVQPQPPHILQPARSPAPDKQRIDVAGRISGIYSPRFVTVCKGFSPDVMCVKKSAVWQRESSSSSVASSADAATASAQEPAYDAAAAGGIPNEEKTEGYSKTTAICRIIGSVDILLSPLLLEAVQRYMEALTPVLALEHPATIIDNLHFDISGSVQSQNKIKKMQARMETQEKLPDGSSTGSSSGGGGWGRDGAKGQGKSAAALQQPRRPRASTLLTASQAAGAGSEPQRDWRLQVMVTIAKVNLCILQASVSEDITPLAAYERMRDLTCVSVLATCLYDIAFTSLLHSHSRSLCSTGTAAISAPGIAAEGAGAVCATLTTAEQDQGERAFLVQHSSMLANEVRQSAAVGTSGKDDDVFEEAKESTATTPEPRSTTPLDAGGRLHSSVETEDSEGLEQNTEEIVGNLSVKQVHCQFRRLQDADLPKSIKLTAISESRSKVMFTITQRRPEPILDDSQKWQRQHQKLSMPKTSSFIMFECGIENLSVNAARRRGFSAALTLISPNNPIGQAAPQAQRVSTTTYFVEKEKDVSSQGQCRKGSEAQNADAIQGILAMRQSSTTGLSGGNSSIPAVSAASAADSSSNPANVEGIKTEQLSGDAMAVTLDMQLVWFSFAAPSHAQSQVDFTRLDWNLLSTASPAIDAWLNPMNRLSTASISLASQHKNRITAVIACVMTTALDMPGMHFIFRGEDYKRSVNTRLSRVVQEDPSCQLMSVLRRYIGDAQVSVIEDSVRVTCMPPLITLQKGMLALTRQWRNQLYMPPATKLGKARRGEFTVHFDLPPSKDTDTEGAGNGGGSRDGGGGVKDDDADSRDSDSDEGADEANERTSLLQPSLGRSPSITSSQSKGKAHVPNARASSSSKHVPTVMESSCSDTLSQSCYDNPANDTADGPTSGGDDNLKKYLSQLEQPEKDDEDLYRWMARQQEYSREAPLGRSAAAAGLGLRRNHSLLRSMVSEVSGDTWSQDQGTIKAPSSPVNSGAVEAVARLADAQLMFRPLLEAVGLNIHGLKSSAIMRNMGGNLSIASKLHNLCIDIVEECVETPLATQSAPSGCSQPLSQKSAARAPGQSQRPQCFITPPSPDEEMSAFACKSLSISVSLKDTLANTNEATGVSGQCSATSTESKRTVFQQQTRADSARPGAQPEPGSTVKQRSAHAISVAMRNLEGSPPTTKAYISVDLVGVTQHVNMALLRLIHQVFTVIENINWTRSQIRKQERLEAHQLTEYRKTHRKQDSSSSADTQYASAPAAQLPNQDMLSSQLGSSVVLAGPGILSREQPPCCGAQLPVTTERRNVISGAKGGSPVAVRRPSKLLLNKHMRKLNISGKHDPLPSSKSAPSPTADVPSPTVGAEARHVGSEMTDRLPLLATAAGTDVGGPGYASSSSPLANSVTPTTPEDELKQLPKLVPECWKKLNHLLELYSKTPETKTVNRRQSLARLSDIVEETDGGVDRSAKSDQVGSSVFPTIASAELGEAAELGRGTMKPPGSCGKEPLPDAPDLQGADDSTRPSAAPTAQPVLVSPEFTKGMFSQATTNGENVLLIVFGYVKVHDIFLRAALSGLKLEAEMRNIYGCLTHKAKEKRIAGSGVGCKRSSEMSVTLSADKSFASLFEDTALPRMQTVVSVNLSSSYCLYASVSKRKRDYNTAVLSIGAINVSIPQHAGTLHSMVTRSSRRIQDTFQQLMRRNSMAGSATTPAGALPAAAGSSSSAISNASLQTAAASLGSCNVSGVQAAPAVEQANGKPASSRASMSALASSSSSPTGGEAAKSSAAAASAATAVDVVDCAAGALPVPPSPDAVSLNPGAKRRKNKPLVMHFQVALKSLAVRASLLPSLKAQYQVGQVTWCGVSGSKASFAVHLTTHSLSFTSEGANRDTSLLPPAASVDLPPMRIDAEYRRPDPSCNVTNEQDVLAQDGQDYLYAVAEVGVFEHSLTTNLLNHLIVVQKVFVKEVNEVLQKVAGSEKTTQPIYMAGSRQDAVVPAPPNMETASNSLVYEVIIKFKGIQVTATTPTSTAVRLETGSIEMEASNRVQQTEPASVTVVPHRVKLFFKVHIDVNLALGQLVKNPMFEEAEAEFHVVSFFATTIDVRNALQDELVPASGSAGVGPRSREAVLISLRRPIFSVQPAAFDKAVMVWLSYRSAYEYWHDQRHSLSAEVHEATRDLITMTRGLTIGGESASLPASIAAARLGLPSRLSSDETVASTLFLQLTITDLGICMPLITQDAAAEPLLSPFLPHGAAGARMPPVGHTRRHTTDSEPSNALVLTIRETQINACSCGSLASRGKFAGFCLRFAKDFEVSLDDWKPDASEEPVMNACIVQRGTVEVCSQTVSSRSASATSPVSTANAQAAPGSAEDVASAKWILNIVWEMEGMDANLNTSISQHLSELGHALTALTGDMEDALPLAATGTLSTTAAPGLTSPKLNVGADEVDSVYMVDASKKSITDVFDQYYDSDMDPKMKLKLIENQSNIVRQLRQSGAKACDVEAEERRLVDLVAALSSELRRDVMDWIRRQSIWATNIKDKLGLGTRQSQHQRSSIVSPVGSSGYSRAKRANLLTLTPVAEHSSFLRESADEDPLDNVDSSVTSANINRILYGDRDMPLPGEGTAVESTSNAPVPRQPGLSSKEADSGPAGSQRQPAAVGSEQPAVVMRRKPRLAPLSLEQPADAGCNQQWARQQERTASSSITATAPETAMDIILEIMVKIKSGHCILHPSEPASSADVEKDANKMAKPFKTSLSSSPASVRKPRGESVTAQLLGTSRSPKPPDNRTVFLVPGIEVKLHYESRTVSHGSPSSSMQRNISPSAIHEMPQFLQQHAERTGQQAVAACLPGSQVVAGRRAGPKRASLYAWIELQALSEEMVVTTKLLDFLEQALEQIDFAQLHPRIEQGAPTAEEPEALGKATEEEEEEEEEEVPAAGAAVTTSSAGASAGSTFPVDIIVYCSVQPSLIRFSCLPVSRIECLLQLPSLSLVFSTQRNDLGTDAAGPAPAVLKRELSSSASTSSTSAGLSVSACLTDFSVFVFHPYGGSTMASGSSSSTTRKDLGSTPWTATSSDSSQGVQDDGAKTGRRIWLSLNMKLLKVHLSRMRRSTVEVVPSLDSAAASNVAGSQPNSDKLCNSVKFSLLVDMDSAEFKFDMRRLSDILDLPKAWYRSSLARRMFLGDETIFQQSASAAVSPKDVAPIISTPLIGANVTERVGPDRPQHRRAMSDGMRSHVTQLQHPSQYQALPGRNTGGGVVTFAPMGSRAFDSIQKPPFSVGGSRSAGSTMLRSDRKKSRAEVAKRKHGDDVGSKVKPQERGGPLLSWRTLVLVAVNLSKFELRINMGNLMGNTVFKTDKLKCQGRLSVDSLGHKEVSASAKLEHSDMEAKGGVTGGLIQLSSVNGFMTLRESRGELPSHKLGIGLMAMETKLDYMGTSVLMLRLSDLDAEVFDEWKLSVSTEVASPLARASQMFAAMAASRANMFGSSGMKRKSSISPVQVFIYGNVGFNQFQVMMTKSTTPDLIKMAARVDEYFRQQMRSSQRMFGANAFGMRSAADFMGSGLGYDNAGNDDAGNAEEAIPSINHRRHWQRVLMRAAESLLVCQQLGCQPLPPRVASATLLGGSLGFQGSNLSLACYHGVNFRSKAWVLFIMQDPSVAFSTEAHDVMSTTEPSKVDTRIVQNFLFSLGQNSTRKIAPNAKMATICKVSRSQMPPTFNTVSEWFAYSFANPELKDYARFDGAGLSVEPSAAAETGATKSKSGSALPGAAVTPGRKSTYKYNHDVETIFALPTLLLQMKTDHLQLHRKPTEADPRPEVMVSFVTEFDGHIAVAMDAELILWLHEVVTAYVRERETQKDIDGKVIDMSTSSKFTTDTTGELKKDWREFVCKVWQLEPTVRLLSWAAGRIEPVGVDYILTQLGFRHARTTIPKWIQRGFMDPCDALSAKLVSSLLRAMQNAAESALDDTSDSDSDDDPLESSNAAKPADDGQGAFTAAAARDGQV